MTSPFMDPTSDPLAAYVDALLECAGQLMLIIDHMAAFDASAPPGTPVDESAPETLRRLVRDVIAGRWYTADEEELLRARALLTHTADAVGREIFLVPGSAADGPACGGARRRTRRRG